jgi:hypothetical protein
MSRYPDSIERSRREIDRINAGLGDPDAKVRMVKWRELDRLEAAEQRGAGSQRGPIDTPETSRKKGSKGISPATTVAVKALAAVLHEEGGGKTARAFARRAAERAQSLSLPGADSLQPEGSSMRALAQAMIDGVAAADAAPEERETGQNRPNPATR